MILGTGLVLLTWSGAIFVVVVLGLAPALIGRGTRSWALILRMSLWWGLLVATGAILVINLRVPLRSAPAAWAFLLAVAFMVAASSWVYLRRGGPSRIDLASRRRWWLAPLFVALALCACLLAVAALGPVTNYDSGLYHLGAVKYAGDFATIHGLANVYAPFGYNNALFPLAAFLGNGLWDGIGFRLVNGLIMMLMASDLVLRLLQRRYSVGTFVLLIGLVASWVPLIALADYWVTSPTSDSAVMILTFVSLAYLCDALSMRRDWQANGAIVVVTGLLLVSMRPIMVFLLIGVLGVLVVRAVRLRALGGDVPELDRVLWCVVAGAAALVAVIQTIRDYFLSGWLQFPLSILSFDVPWRAPDPTLLREATLGAARDAANFREASQGWSWVGPWFEALPSQWEVYELGALTLGAFVLILLARRWRCDLRARTLLLALTPSGLTVLVWFVAAPPTFRMAWGPIFCLAVIPCGWALHAIYRSPTTTPTRRARLEAMVCSGGASVLAILCVFCTLTRLDIDSMTNERAISAGMISVPYSVSPVALPDVQSLTLASGVSVLWPGATDQCWDVYPLCTPWPEPDLRMMGPAIQDGFKIDS